VPLFGTVAIQPRVTRQAERRETSRKIYPTREEHIAFLRLLGHTGIVIPGEPEYIAARELWIESYRAYSPLEQQQLERYRKDLQLCQAMKQPSSPGNSAAIQR